jgi:TIR domain
MPMIVISYRRSDSADIAGRIFDRLSAHYGEHSVFMDIDNVPFGTDFRTHIQETLYKTDVVLAIVGPNWLGRRVDGATRMQEDRDPVRVEIETALKLQTPIIPVLVAGAKMPSSDELPKELGNFVYLNAPEVASGRDFRAHMDRVIAAIDRIAPADDELSKIRRAFLGAKNLWDLERAQHAINLFIRRAPENIDALQLRDQIESAIGHERASATPAARSLTSQAMPATADGNASVPQAWASDALRYFVVPLVVLLVAHHVIVNVFDLKIAFLWIACVVIPLLFGFLYSWLICRGAGPTVVMAVALGIITAGGMTVSQSLNSDDPLLPQNRFEWRDNIQFAAGIALGFLVGYALARAVRSLQRQKFGKQ